jgi:hypothetical protein
MKLKKLRKKVLKAYTETLRLQGVFESVVAPSGESKVAS